MKTEEYAKRTYCPNRPGIVQLKMIINGLIAKGYSAEQIARVHTPIGLEIGPETPAEIAVGIVAELVKERAGRQ